jgi:hypothetical protein
MRPTLYKIVILSEAKDLLFSGSVTNESEGPAFNKIVIISMNCHPEQSESLP